MNTKAGRPTAALVNTGGPAPLYFADADRAQRNTVALRDVDYLIEARLSLTDRAGQGDNMTKFVEMFRRRIAKGQHFHQPYFGCREFAANIVAADNAPAPVNDTRDLGIMLWDIDFTEKDNRPIFFHGRLEHGVLNVPADPEATLTDLEQQGGDHT